MTELEKKELTLRELVQRSGLDQPTVDNICKNMEEAIEAKNSILRNLKYSLAHATKAYNDAIRVYEAKLVEFGIPAEELGLEPLVTNTSTMPAGLVAAWRRNRLDGIQIKRHYYIEEGICFISYSFKES